MRQRNPLILLTIYLWSSLGLGLAGPAQAQDFDSQAPGWSLDAGVRLRTEYLADSFRLVAPAVDHLQFSRSEVALSYQAPSWQMVLEIQDSRAWGAETFFSPIGTDDVNSLEPINVKLSKQWRLNTDSALLLTAGRMTIDYGSRRLLARNNFRNTSNAFQGIHVLKTSAHSKTAVFYTLPLQRRPNLGDLASLKNNDFELDKAGRGERFWGASFDYTASTAVVSAYIFASELSDRANRPVPDRELVTLGSRLTWRGAGLDMEAEAAYQWGDSLATALAGPDDLLNHRAWFTHLHIGFDFRRNFNLRLAYDHATGDRDPFDGRNERFDRLYGARAFELGPSGIFGAAVRSNLRAPALRLRWQATAAQSWLLSYRWLSLDSPRDFFVTGVRRDPSGASGRDLGQQWELRWRWKPENQSLSLDLGAAYLDKGRYFDGSLTAPLNPPSPEDSQYVFTQVTWRY